MANQSQLESAVLQLADFVHMYLPFANAHNTDFITHGHWQRLLPPPVAQELLLLDDTTLVALPGAPQELTYRNIGSGDECIILPDIQLSTYDESVQKDQLGRPEWDKKILPSWKHDDLKSFLADARSHTLEGLGVLDSLEEVLKEWEKPTEEETVFVHSHMSAKKGHEVELMAHVCHLLAKQQGIGKVIDVGSGRGYLSCHLSQMYDLLVLGIDSSDINTHSAEHRSKKLQKHWNGLLRNAKQDKKMKISQRDTGQLNPESNTEKVDFEAVDTPVPDGYSCKHNDSNLTSKGAQPSLSPEETKIQNVQSDTKHDASSRCHQKGSYIPVTLFVKPDMDLNQLLQKHLVLNSVPSCNELNHDRDALPNSETIQDEPTECSGCTDHQYITSPGNDGIESEKTNQHEPSTGAHSCSSSRSKQSDFVLTGLHTCGGLAATMLELYSNNPHVTAFASVGCCYHLLEEHYIANPFRMQDDIDKSEIAFPLSSALQCRKFCLGRNARLLACQAVSRLTEQATLPPDSLFHRALLQLILRDLTGETRLDWKVGRIAAKTKSFPDYILKCLKKLGLKHSLTEDNIKEYEHRYAGHCRRLQAFFQLKAVLAPCIESLVVLDRFLYLKEKNLTDRSHLVRMFNPVTSPRCYGILSLRTTVS